MKHKAHFNSFYTFPMKKIYISLFVIHLLLSFPHISYGQNLTTETNVIVQNLNVRSEPRFGNNIIDHLSYGNVVGASITDDSTWCRIQYVIRKQQENYKKAYVACKYLSRLESSPEYIEIPYTFLKNITSLNVRSTPAFGKNIIGKIDTSTTDFVTVLWDQGKKENIFTTPWCRIKHKNTSNAFVACKYLTR